MEAVTSNYLKKISFLILISISLGKTVEGASMSLFSKEKHEVVVSSPFEGVISINGSIAPNAKIERVLKWGDEEDTETVFTDDDGKFTLQVKRAEIEVNPLVQFTAHQKIFVYYQGEKYQIWVMGKLDKELYAELNGKPVNVQCGLNDSIRRIESPGGLLGTSCTWDGLDYDQKVVSSYFKET